MKKLILITLLGLTACSPGYDPRYNCEYRETQSGTCTAGEYICDKPMQMTQWHGAPRCMMPGDAR